ncbi:putative metalloprotease CJM1_0395 family protein [Pseudomonas sp. 5P_3.1_Bac2]|uniref:putative metalloprotease CJM1_0395 family protein n=1 Tax=Pseudomonas sp. 5P_3.1_Bac2 TaxID=2971617 RepID=UPI0021C9D574|nr:putative metalloprotease CJM1_0395 family protein [Pseudomonas sp. 5P_3.1_Bac2]MCU1717769.1 hypothetical protein [Pseudomonas sp. 5P_3.1_Bac2]
MQITSTNAYFSLPANGQRAARAGEQSSASPSTASNSVDDSSASAAKYDQRRLSASDAEQRIVQAEQEEIRHLSRRDQEVRAHEQAHAAVGANHAGAPSYSYTYGPDGKRYATEGEVSISTAKVAGDPAATLRKMAKVLAAALAPAEPSAQDRQVAAQAQLLMSQAQLEVLQLQREQRPNGAAEQTAKAPERGAARAAPLETYQSLSRLAPPEQTINLQV